ncbi:MAG TPA: hypothetical protein VMZ25_09415 [Terriglobales bacterium]|nr:hypothetical protein [Terriglobales bacterium]
MSMRLSRRIAPLLAAAITFLIAASALSIAGWGPAGLASAARNTARFSGVVFALALIARSTRFPQLFVKRWEMFFAFVAAHGVHFAAVLMLAVFDQTHELHRMEPKPAGILLAGFGLLLMASVTAGKPASPFQSRAHTLFFYGLGVIFLVGFGSRAVHSTTSAMMMAVVIAAFILRALPRNGVTAPATASTP